MLIYYTYLPTHPCDLALNDFEKLFKKNYFRSPLFIYFQKDQIKKNNSLINLLIFRKKVILEPEYSILALYFYFTNYCYMFFLNSSSFWFCWNEGNDLFFIIIFFYSKVKQTRKKYFWNNLLAEIVLIAVKAHYTFCEKKCML